jgi:hypothetical protein
MFQLQLDVSVFGCLTMYGCSRVLLVPFTVHAFSYVSIKRVCACVWCGVYLYGIGQSTATRAESQSKNNNWSWCRHTFHSPGPIFQMHRLHVMALAIYTYSTEYLHVNVVLPTDRPTDIVLGSRVRAYSCVAYIKTSL